jgi:hypothetical protein
VGGLVLGDKLVGGAQLGEKAQLHQVVNVELTRFTDGDRSDEHQGVVVKCLEGLAWRSTLAEDHQATTYRVKNLPKLGPMLWNSLQVGL